MCYSMRQILIKSINLHGYKFLSVPCGQCEECRTQQKSSWSVRLAAELDKKRKDGWLIGFCTLTYSNRYLPHVPRECFVKNPHKVACFSRRHVRTFIDSLRKLYHAHYGGKSLVYLAASEYGERTHRPHYHVLLAWQPLRSRDSAALAPILDAVTMHRYVCRLWRYGHIIPWNALGGYDSKNRYHNPFEVAATATDAAFYAAKYVCKDLSFEASLRDVCKKHSLFKDCKYFHIQSRSLGFCLIQDKTDNEKKSLYMDGVDLPARDKKVILPRYLVNKLLFNVKYIFLDARDGHKWTRRLKSKRSKTNRSKYEYIDLMTGECFSKQPDRCKRFVRREISDFFKNHVKDIFHKKVSCKQDFMFNLLFDPIYQFSLDIPEEIKKEIPQIKKDIFNYEQKYCKQSNRCFAVDCTLYYGISGNHCKSTKRIEEFYLNRFQEKESFAHNPNISEEQYYEILSISNKLSRIFASRRDYIFLRQRNKTLNEVNDFWRE